MGNANIPNKLVTTQAVVHALLKTCALQTARNVLLTNVDPLSVPALSTKGVNSLVHSVTLIANGVNFRVEANGDGRLAPDQTAILKAVRETIGKSIMAENLQYQFETSCLSKTDYPQRIPFALPADLESPEIHEDQGKYYGVSGSSCTAEGSIETILVPFVSEHTVIEVVAQPEPLKATRSSALKHRITHPSKASYCLLARENEENWYKFMQQKAISIGNTIALKTADFDEAGGIADLMRSALSLNPSARLVGVPLDMPGHAVSLVFDTSSGVLWFNDTSNSPILDSAEAAMCKAVELVYGKPPLFFTKTFDSNIQYADEADPETGNFGQCTIWRAFLLFTVCGLGMDPENVRREFTSLDRAELKMRLRFFKVNMETVDILKK